MRPSVQPSCLRDNRAMTRRAVLIGSETYGLRGCDADVSLMREVLAARGFDAIEVRTGHDASRAGIVDALEQLIASIAADDAALVYYSGHGGRVVRPDFEERKAARLSVHFQFIVPFDMDDSAPGDFRGVLSEELTTYQRRMTDRFHQLGTVPNVTTVLDCCHSGYMARAIEAMPKSVDFETKSFRVRGIREHAAALGTETVGGLATNPDAVRLVACQSEQSAFEFPSSRGGRHGALTDAFASVLQELGPAPVSWRVAGELVRRRVRALVPEQRPDLEGPGDRLVFSADSLAQADGLAISLVDTEPTIEAAAILGISVGDEFRLVIAGHEDTIGTAVVIRVDGSGAALEVTPDAARDALQSNALAVPTRLTLPKVQVFVGYSGSSADELCTQLTESSRLRVAADHTSAAAAVTNEPGGLALLDQVGDRWRIDAFPDDVAGHRRLVREIESIAVGHRLLDLPSGEGASALGPAVSIEFGVIDDGHRRTLPTRGERLRAGTPVFLTMRNTSTDPLFVWVFDVGVSGRSSLLTNATSSGTMLGAAGAEDDTLDLWGAKGESLFWPPDVPAATTRAAEAPGRWETFVVLTADQRGDLSSLASRAAAERGVVRSPLDALIQEARTGVREVAATGPTVTPLRYRLDTVEFMLLPT